MDWKIPLFKIYWDDRDIENISETIRSGGYWAEGPSISLLEEKIAQYIGTKYAAVFNSGTSALHAVLLAYGINKGDEVIVPSFTFVATANAPLFVGSKPVFADIEKETLGLNPESVVEKITSRTKAIITVHYGGCPCQAKELKEIAEDRKLLLIEDAAESFGARIAGEKVGTFGDSAMLSFCQNKVITTGEGGAIVTDSKQIWEKLKMIRSHGRGETNYFTSNKYVDYVTLGYNFRMSSITAALGLSQLEKADRIIEMRRQNAKYMTEKLQHIKEVTVPLPSPEVYHVYQLYTIRVDKRVRNKLMKYLAAKGIMTKVYFFPIHLNHFYRNELKLKCSLPASEEISHKVLTLPMYPTLRKDEIEFITNEVGNFFNNKPYF